MVNTFEETPFCNQSGRNLLRYNKRTIFSGCVCTTIGGEWNIEYNSQWYVVITSPVSTFSFNLDFRSDVSRTV